MSEHRSFGACAICPLLKSGPAGEPLAYGVVSWGSSFADLPCDHGGSYSTFDGDVSDFLTYAPEWVDPCGTLSTQ